MADLFKIEVAYATPERQLILTVDSDQEMSVATVIEQSGILEEFNEIDLAATPVGIFSKICKLTDKVHAGDRIEIYRPLLLDPKELRRQRAAIQAKR